MRTENKTWEQLFEKTSHIVKAFRDDLILHDKTAIEKAHPENTPFIHFSRESGTHIVFLDAADMGR